MDRTRTPRSTKPQDPGQARQSPIMDSPQSDRRRIADIVLPFGDPMNARQARRQLGLIAGFIVLQLAALYLIVSQPAALAFWWGIR